jgi:hypothetical protein
MTAGKREIAVQARERRNALRADLAGRFPHLVPAPIPRADPGAIVPGRDGNGAPLLLSVRARLEHTLAIGTTGGGKTKFIEQCARQDIVQGRGVCIIDPHGNHPDSLYSSMLSWLDERGFTNTRTIHLIDPNAGSHVTGINPLQLPSAEYEPTVIAEATLQALERMWGEEDMNTKPTMQRVLSATLTALTELGLTLAEARLLFDPDDRHGLRAWAIDKLVNEEARDELEWLHRMAAEPRGHQDFRQEVTGPRNRLAKLTRDDAIRLMVGQQKRTIDLRAALDDGHIILANLSPGPRAGDKAMQLLGRLITRSLFFHCVRRRHSERPFFFYLDECQLYLSGDISRMLAEARKYGLGAVLSTQALASLRVAGDDVLDAIKNMTNTKVVLRIKNPEEAAELAEMVFQYDLEMPVRALIKPTVTGHRVARLIGESTSEQSATTRSRSHSKGESLTESSTYTHGIAETLGEATGYSESASQSVGSATSTGEVTGEGSGTAAATQSMPNGSLFGTNPVVGFAQGESTQSYAAHSQAAQSSVGSTAGSSTSRTSSRAVTKSESWSEGLACGRSRSDSIGLAESRGQAKTLGWRETFEPILEERPSAVHGVEALRYMASSALRGLQTGSAAVSFVDGGGMKTVALKVANVESYALPAAEFEALRLRVLNASPSATPLTEAIAHVADRHATLKAYAAQAEEPADPAEFRTKRKRPLPFVSSVKVHDEQKAARRRPVKGREIAGGDGRRPPLTGSTGR